MERAHSEEGTDKLMWGTLLTASETAKVRKQRKMELSSIVGHGETACPTMESEVSVLSSKYLNYFKIYLFIQPNF